jgi:hypothetical protein
MATPQHNYRVLRKHRGRREVRGDGFIWVDIPHLRKLIELAIATQGQHVFAGRGYDFTIIAPDGYRWTYYSPSQRPWEETHE